MLVCLNKTVHNCRVTVKFLDVTFRQPDWMLHPMQELIRFEDIVVHDELRTWNLMPDREIEYELFYVEVTDRERYLETLETVESVVEYTVSPVAEDDRAFYVYVCQETREEDLLFREAFSALELVVVPPIIYDEDAAMRMTIVGAGESLQDLVGNVPSEIDTTVHQIGDYDRRQGTLAGILTDRQYEAIATAFDCGYYDVPKTGSLEDVSAELECAPSTASNHLQKAESAIIERIVTRRSARE